MEFFQNKDKNLSINETAARKQNLLGSKTLIRPIKSFSQISNSASSYIVPKHNFPKSRSIAPSRVVFIPKRPLHKSISINDQSTFFSLNSPTLTSSNKNIVQSPAKNWSVNTFHDQHSQNIQRNYTKKPKLSHKTNNERLEVDKTIATSSKKDKNTVFLQPEKALNLKEFIQSKKKKKYRMLWNIRSQNRKFGRESSYILE